MVEPEPAVKTETTTAEPPAGKTEAAATATATEATTPKETIGGHTLLSSKSDGEKTGEAAPGPAGAPEKYDAFKYPDGMKGYEGEKLDSLHGLFKEAGLSQDQAQKLVDFHNNEIGSVANSHTEAWNAANTEWRNQLKGDKTIGSGTDSILKPEVSSALSKLIDTHLGGDSFRAAMEQTGAGNHPAVVKGLYAMAQKMNEGKAVEGEPPREAPRRSIAQRMYPTLVKET